VIPPTDVENLGFETDFALEISLGKILHVLSHVLAGQPTSGLDGVFRRPHRHGGKPELPMHASKILHWIPGVEQVGGKDGPIDFESGIYALLRPNAAHGFVAGEYLDSLETILK
jgi:hypothetical protein